MNSSPAAYSTETADDRHAFLRLSRSVSWGAILVGLVAAMALQVVFMLLGAGLGFALYSPLTDAKPMADFGAGAMVIQGMSAIVSLWFGGWVAGRFTPIVLRSTAWLHGLAVWCAATVAGVLLVSAGAGWAMGDLSKVVGGGLSLAGKPVAAAVGDANDLAKDAATQSKGALGSFSDEALGNRPADAPKASGIRAKREVGMAIGRLFNPLQMDQRQNNRAAAVQALVSDAGMNEADANRMVDDWISTYDRLQADLAAAKNAAEVKAREAADEAAEALAIFSLCAFCGLVLGAVAAACGGRRGAKVASEHDALASIPA